MGLKLAENVTLVMLSAVCTPIGLLGSRLRFLTIGGRAGWR